MTNDELIGKLLALKRHERPPAGYHTAFLYEFRRRQRAALMHRSRLVLFIENLGDLWPGLHVPKLAYATLAAVAVAAAGLVVLSPSAGPVAVPSPPPTGHDDGYQTRIGRASRFAALCPSAASGQQ